MHVPVGGAGLGARGGDHQEVYKLRVQYIHGQVFLSHAITLSSFRGDRTRARRGHLCLKYPSTARPWLCEGQDLRVLQVTLRFLTHHWTLSACTLGVLLSSDPSKGSLISRQSSC